MQTLHSDIAELCSLKPQKRRDPQADNDPSGLVDRNVCIDCRMVMNTLGKMPSRVSPRRYDILILPPVALLIASKINVLVPNFPL